MGAGELRRRLVFYGWENAGDVSFDRIAASRSVSALEGADWALEEGDFTSAVLVDREGTDDEPTCLRCFRLRTGEDVPHKLDATHDPAPLQLLEDEAITDWTHVVIWPDNFAAHDARRDAPALSRLARFLRERAEQRVRFFPLYDRGLVDELRELEHIKAVELRIQLARADQLEEAAGAGLFGGLAAVGREAEGVLMQTKISVGHKRRRFLSGRVQDEVVALAEGAEEFLDSLVITGIRNNRTVQIDVLRSRLERNTRVPKAPQLGNAPAPDTMYDAIMAARRELETADRLQRAARLR